MAATSTALPAPHWPTGFVSQVDQGAPVALSVFGTPYTVPPGRYFELTGFSTFAESGASGIRLQCKRGALTFYVDPFTGGAISDGAPSFGAPRLIFQAGDVIQPYTVSGNAAWVFDTMYCGYEYSL